MEEVEEPMSMLYCTTVLEQLAASLQHREVHKSGKT
jgi:hypothetical protein